MDEDKGKGSMKELLTPEQDAMWKSRHRDESKALGPDQKKEFNKGLRQKLKKMSDSDLANTRTALQAEWDALPISRREKLREKITAKGGKGGAGA
ncbi:MAG: hypothetical protein ACR2FH_01990 [Caulobacteraceae bacterium]